MPGPTAAETPGRSPATPAGLLFAYDQPARAGQELARRALVLCAALVPSCSFVRADVPSPVEIPASFSESGEGALPDRWWTELGDESLAALVEEALAGNLDLRAVWDRLAQAEALARREGAPLVPEVEARASTTRTEITTTAARGTGAGGRNDVGFGLGASYEIDLWGRVRSTRDAARLDAEATLEELHAAAITLSAEIARRWYELAEQRSQLALLDEQITTNDRVLELVRLRFRKGQVGATDVLRQRQLVESTRGDRAPVEARAAVLEHELAVLTGRAPGAPILTGTLVSLPPLPDPGLPAQLVTRRPDVRQALQRVRAADRRLAAALADRYPRLALTGSASFSAEALSDVLDNWIATTTASLIAPVVDGGRRRAEVDRNEAVVSERVHAYGQTILVSLREVEDALVRERTQGTRIESLDSQLETSKAVVDRLRDQYLHGSVSYLDVLQALITHQSLQRSRLTAELDRIRFRIDLYRALAGGFDLERPALAAIGSETHP